MESWDQRGAETKQVTVTALTWHLAEAMIMRAPEQGTNVRQAPRGSNGIDCEKP